MKPFKMDKCPWKFIGEDTAGKIYIYWCEDCGAIYSEGAPANLENPMRVDQETYLCPDQGIKV